MLKIHILGGPGSGKTTLGQEIASRFALSLYELDMIGRKNGLQHTAYLQDAFAIVSQPGWVTEGVGLIWTDPFLDHADYIILLEISWPTAAYRIVRRHISKSLQGTNLYPGIKRLFLFLKDSNDYYSNQCSSETEAVINRYLEEHRQDTAALNAGQLLARLEKYGLELILPATEEFVRAYLEKYKQKIIRVRSNADRKRLLALLARYQ